MNYFLKQAPVVNQDLLDMLNNLSKHLCEQDNGHKNSHVNEFWIL